MVVEGDEEFFVAHNFLAPGGGVEGLELVERFFGESEAAPVDVLVAGHPADGGFFSEDAAVNTIDDPLEDAHVFAEARPEEFAVGVLAEPVYVEDLGGLAEVAGHLQPVTEVVAYVVAAEGQQGHGIAAYLSDGSGGGGGHFGTHGGAGVYSGAPVEGLVDERHGGGAAATEDHGADRHAFGIFPRGVDGRTL